MTRYPFYILVNPTNQTARNEQNFGMGNWESGIGNWESGIGRRQQATALEPWSPLPWSFVAIEV
ncbi:MAG: hypothetical protein F6K47_12740 [Symploca sp. SIO2E6]|nr:hypothetical protein [Symploca sp. SIO2E6]